MEPELSRVHRLDNPIFPGAGIQGAGIGWIHRQPVHFHILRHAVAFLFPTISDICFFVDTTTMPNTTIEWPTIWNNNCPSAQVSYTYVSGIPILSSISAIPKTMFMVGYQHFSMVNGIDFHIINVIIIQSPPVAAKFFLPGCASIHTFKNIPHQAAIDAGGGKQRGWLLGIDLQVINDMAAKLGSAGCLPGYPAIHRLVDTPAVGAGIDNLGIGGMNRQGLNIGVSQSGIDRRPGCSTIDRFINPSPPGADVKDSRLSRIQRQGWHGSPGRSHGIHPGGNCNR